MSSSYVVILDDTYWSPYVEVIEETPLPIAPDSPR